MRPCSYHNDPPAYDYLLFFFFNDTATTEIYTLSLHDALPISAATNAWMACFGDAQRTNVSAPAARMLATSDATDTSLTSYDSVATTCAACGPSPRRRPASRFEPYSESS